MAHIEDRWFKTVSGPDGKKVKEKTRLHGTGMRYRVRYISPDGLERSRSFPDRQRRDAEAFMVSIETDKLRGSYVDPAAGRMTFGDYAERWLKAHAVDESTRESMEQRIGKHVMPYFSTRRLSSITPGDIREWDKELEKTLAVTTRSVAFAYLRSIFAAAVDDEKIVKNPCSARSVKQPRPPMRRVVPWSGDMVARVKHGLADRYQLVVDLGAGCGLRAGEIFGIGLNDLDLNGGWLHVQRQIKIVRNRMVFGLPKNDRDRKVPLPETVISGLRRQLGTVGVLPITLPWERPDSKDRVTVPLLLTTTRKGPLKRTDFYRKMWGPSVQAAGLESERLTGLHALRHFYASRLLDAGESIKALAEYLGHSDPAFTLRVYTHLMPSSETRTRKAIDDTFRQVDGLATAWETE